MNFMIIISLLILIGFAVTGFRRGMVRTLFMTFGVVVALVFAAYFSAYISDFLISTPVESALTGITEKVLFGDEDDSGIISSETEAIGDLALPLFIKNELAENNTEESYEALGTDSFRGYVSGYVSELILKIVAFFITYIIVIILLGMAEGVLDMAAHLPVLSAMNALGGLLIGLVNGLVVLWLLYMLIAMISGTGLGEMLYAQLQECLPFKILYDQNLIMRMIPDVLG